MRVLITGGSGLLGREITRAFQADHDVLALSHSRTGEGLLPTDLRDSDALAEIIRDFEPELVVHSAAYRNPDYCAENQADALSLNVEPLNIFCGELDPDARIVLISSDYVFDGEHPPYFEDSERHPLNFYGETKCMAEDLIAQRSGSLALRVPVLIGRDDSFEKSGFVYNLVSAVRNGEPVEMDDTLARFPTWTRDVAAALRFAIDQRIVGSLHYSGLEGGTQYRFALRTAELLGMSAGHISPAQVKRRARRPLDSQLAVEKIQSLGFDRFTAFADALDQIINSG